MTADHSSSRQPNYTEMERGINTRTHRERRLFKTTNRFRLLPIKPPVLLFHPFIMAAPPLFSSVVRKTAYTPLASCSQTELLWPRSLPLTPPTWHFSQHFPPTIPKSRAPVCNFSMLPESKERCWACPVALPPWYVQKHAHTLLWCMESIRLHWAARCDGLELLASLLSARRDDKLFMCPWTFVEQ